jgi:hypothetical protein
MENETGDSSKVQIVAGPFLSHFEEEKYKWELIFSDVKKNL